MRIKETPIRISYYVGLRKSENNTADLFELFIRGEKPYITQPKSSLVSIERVDNVDWDIRRLTFQFTKPHALKVNQDAINIILDGVYHWVDLETVDRLSSWFLMHFRKSITEYKGTRWDINNSGRGTTIITLNK